MNSVSLQTNRVVVAGLVVEVVEAATVVNGLVVVVVVVDLGSVAGGKVGLGCVVTALIVVVTSMHCEPTNW